MAMSARLAGTGVSVQAGPRVTTGTMIARTGADHTIAEGRSRTGQPTRFTSAGSEGCAGSGSMSPGKRARWSSASLAEP